MTYQQLIEMGAKEIAPLKIWPSREKVFGRMWSGEAELELDGIVFKFDIWHHGPNNEGEAIEEIKLTNKPKFIQIGPSFYDAYWHTIMRFNEIWLHRKGWFNDLSFRKEVNELERNWDPKVAEKLGFVKLI